MKKHFSIFAIALMAVTVAFVSCKKKPEPEPQPEAPTYAKTTVNAQLHCSTDLTDFMNVSFSVIDFEGNEQNMSVTDTTSHIFTTTAKDASLKTVFVISPKTEEEWPEIDPEREYWFTLNGLGGIFAYDSEDNIIDYVNEMLVDLPVVGTIMVNGNQMTPEHIARLQETFDSSKTITFSVVNGETVTAVAEGE